MASIYQKTLSDKTCILSPREFILRPFDFGDDWTEMRMGFLFSGISSSGDNTNSASETVVLNSAMDRITAGIKDSATNDLPGYGSALFLGAVSGAAGAITNGSAFYGQATDTLNAAGYHDTTLVNGTSSLGANTSMQYPPNASASSSYDGFWAIKFVISNRGLSSQSVALSVYGAASIGGTDYSASALQALVNGVTYGTPVSIAWNTGAAARDIPDAFFLRLPFYNNRIRLSAIYAARYAP